MEKMKRLEEIMNLDTRCAGFAVADLAEGTSRSMRLADFYEEAARVRVSETAPEHVRSYLEAVKTLFAYGWYYYPFFTFGAFLATTAVEMALHARLKKPRDDSSGLKKLFEQAINEGLLRDDGFPSREQERAERKLLYGQNSESHGDSTAGERPSYTQQVANGFRHFRNVFAHPSDHWILLPGQALSFLVLAGEVINQLWPSQIAGAKA